MTCRLSFNKSHTLQIRTCNEYKPSFNCHFKQTVERKYSTLIIGEHARAVSRTFLNELSQSSRLLMLFQGFTAMYQST